MHMKNQKKLFEIKIPSWYGSIMLLIKNIRGLKELSNVSKHKFKSSYKDVIPITNHWFDNIKMKWEST
jgi:hypothetical protein